MKINGWDIARADARQWNVTPGFHEVENESEWVPGSPVPVLFNSTMDFKPLTVKLLVKSDGGRQALLARCSLILSKLRTPVTLELDRFTHKFYGIMTKATHKEDAMRRFHTLTLSFDCYEYGPEIVVPSALMRSGENKKPLTVYNPGNTLTPVVVTVTSDASTTPEATLTGISHDSRTWADIPVKIKSLPKDTPVVLDGETGLFTEGTKAATKDVDIWELPTLLPGMNVITADNIWLAIGVKFRPRYM